jgi:hypothetical protein
VVKRALEDYAKRKLTRAEIKVSVLDTKISIVSSVILLFCYPSSDTIHQNVNLLKFLFNIPDLQLQKCLFCLGIATFKTYYLLKILWFSLLKTEKEKMLQKFMSKP